MDPIATAAYGMFAATKKFEASAFRVAQMGDPNANVDLAAETVTQVTAKNEFSANVKVMQTAQDMMGDLLDIIA